MFAYDYPIYVIRYPKYWMVQDKPKKAYYQASDRENLLFHIAKNDYFGTLATVLNLMAETVHDKNLSPKIRDWRIKTLRQTSQNLIFLQEHYSIVPQNEKSI